MKSTEFLHVLPLLFILSFRLFIFLFYDHQFLLKIVQFHMLKYIKSQGFLFFSELQRRLLRTQCSIPGFWSTTEEIASKLMVFILHQVSLFCRTLVQIIILLIFTLLRLSTKIVIEWIVDNDVLWSWYFSDDIQCFKYINCIIYTSLNI